MGRKKAFATILTFVLLAGIAAGCSDGAASSLSGQSAAVSSAVSLQEGSSSVAYFLYPIETDRPISKIIKMTKLGDVLQTQNLSHHLEDPYIDRSYAAIEYIDCGSYAIKVDKTNDYSYMLWAMQGSEEILLSRNVNHFAVTGNGLTYYSGYTNDDGYREFVGVYNGAEAKRLALGTATLPALNNSYITGKDGRIYIGAMVAEDNIYGADSFFTLYEATGTVDKPDALKPVLSIDLPGEDMSYWLVDIQYREYGNFGIFEKLDGSYVLLNTLTGQCLAYKVPGLEILQ